MSLQKREKVLLQLLTPLQLPTSLLEVMFYKNEKLHYL